MRIVDALSGEFFLNNRPNGGTAVFLRSLFVTAWLLVLVLPLKSYFAAGTTLHFSFEALKKELGELIPWAGAIFAAAYAGFYSRFAAQWSYLAGLYNHMMATCVLMPAELSRNNRAFAIWQAAFVEDAQDLHLARKSMFRSVVVDLLQREEVVRVFLESTEDGPKRLRELEAVLAFKAAAPTHFEARSDDCVTCVQDSSAPA